MTDTITIIRGAAGQRLAKLIRADGSIEDYQAGYRFDLIPHPVADLAALHDLVRRLVHRSDCAVVWGVPIDPARCARVRRLAYVCRKKGDAPTLRDAAHSWVALDMDGVARPDGIAAADLHACGLAAVQRLPVEFHAAAAIVQATASHGIKPGSRVRLWYWLSRRTDGGELRRWLRGAVDDCTFRTVQPIYTAAPVFAAGVRDHLPTRIALLPGGPAVAVPSPAELAPPAPRPPAPMPAPNAPGAGRYASRALASAAVRVQAAPIGNRHATVLSEARGLARFITAGLLTERDVIGTLEAAGQQAGKPADEIASIIAWAMNKPSQAELPQGTHR
jgi:hypothetical protein